MPEQQTPSESSLKPWTQDETISFPAPDRELIRRAHAHLVGIEDPREKWRRQQYEVAMSGLKVTIQALRALYPEEAPNLSDEVAEEVNQALGNVEMAFRALNTCSQFFLGAALDGVLRGVMGHEELDQMEIPK